MWQIQNFRMIVLFLGVLKKNAFKTNGQPMGGHVLLLLLLFLLTSQNRQGFPSFWIQKIGMKTNQTWQFVYNFRALSESQAGSKNGCWYIYIYISISSKRAFLAGSPSSSTWRQRRDWEIVCYLEIFFLDQKNDMAWIEKRVFLQMPGDGGPGGRAH